MKAETLNYGHVVGTKLPFERAVELTKQYLKDEGFGVLCEIDVAATMKEKLGIDHEPYKILGACNPHYAHQVLSRHPQVGLLLPCNVVVQVQGSETIVSAIDARALVSMVDSANLGSLADEVNEHLKSVLARVETAKV